MPRNHSTTLSRSPPGERVPQVLGCERQREPDRGHLDHPLVDGLPARAPVLRALGIGAVGESGRPPIPVREGPAPGHEGHDPPQQSCVALQFGDPRRERRPEAAEARPCAAGGEVRDDGLHQVDHSPAHVVFGRERVARHGVGARVVEHGRFGTHAMRSRSSDRTWWRSGSPARKRRTSATARSPMREISVPREPAMCGVSTTFGRS